MSKNKKYVLKTDLREEFMKEMDTDIFNNDGEIDIDYVLWLEEKIIHLTNLII